MTLKVITHCIDDRYTLPEKLRIDGLAITVFGVTSAFFFTIIDLLIEKVSSVGMITYIVLALSSIFIAGKLGNYILFILLKKLKLLKE